MRCPICKKPAGRYPENPYAPFCSKRCKLIDLGKWLGEEYRVPGEPAPAAAAGPEAPEKKGNNGDGD
jgi:hypothetical protein